MAEGFVDITNIPAMYPNFTWLSAEDNDYIQKKVKEVLVKENIEETTANVITIAETILKTDAKFKKEK